MDQGMLGKIGNKVDEAGSSSKVSRERVTPDKAQQSPPSTSDTVNLTNDAKLLAKLDETLASLPVVDGARVAEIKTAIENGDYEINAEAIADAMIRMDRSFGE